VLLGAKFLCSSSMDRCWVLVRLTLLRADLENAKAQNTRLRDQLAAAEARLRELLGAEAAADVGWTPPDVQRRLDEYTDQQARDKARIRELEEELEQVRRLNRELTAEANRTRPGSSGHPPSCRA
jgi:chromosome segregation ATPase